jgi:hypothetical protein
MLLAGRKGYVPSRRWQRQSSGSGSSSREEVGALQEAERGIPQPRTAATTSRPSDAMRWSSRAEQQWCAGQEGGRPANGAQLAEDQSDATTGSDREALANRRHEGSVRNYQTGTALAGECQRIHGWSARCQRRPAITSAGVVLEGASTPP